MTIALLDSTGIVNVKPSYDNEEDYDPLSFEQGDDMLIDCLDALNGALDSISKPDIIINQDQASALQATITPLKEAAGLMTREEFNVSSFNGKASCIYQQKLAQEGIASSIWEGVKAFFRKIGEFFSRLFGGSGNSSKGKETTERIKANNEKIEADVKKIENECEAIKDNLRKSNEALEKKLEDAKAAARAVDDNEKAAKEKERIKMVTELNANGANLMHLATNGGTNDEFRNRLKPCLDNIDAIKGNKKTSSSINKALERAYDYLNNAASVDLRLPIEKGPDAFASCITTFSKIERKDHSDIIEKLLDVLYVYANIIRKANIQKYVKLVISGISDLKEEDKKEIIEMTAKLKEELTSGIKDVSLKMVYEDSEIEVTQDQENPIKLKFNIKRNQEIKTIHEQLGHIGDYKLRFDNKIYLEAFNASQKVLDASIEYLKVEERLSKFETDIKHLLNDVLMLDELKATIEKIEGNISNEIYNSIKLLISIFSNLKTLLGNIRLIKSDDTAFLLKCSNFMGHLVNSAKEYCHVVSEVSEIALKSVNSL